jgi:hypothetical protein
MLPVDVSDICLSDIVVWLVYVGTVCGVLRWLWQFALLDVFFQRVSRSNTPRKLECSFDVSVYDDVYAKFVLTSRQISSGAQDLSNLESDSIVLQISVSVVA